MCVCGIDVSERSVIVSRNAQDLVRHLTECPDVSTEVMRLTFLDLRSKQVLVDLRQALNDLSGFLLEHDC